MKTYMRALGLALAMLCAFNAHAAQALLPNASSVVTLPAGVAKVADYGGLFPHPTTLTVELCAADFTACSKPYSFIESDNSMYCTVVNFPGMPASGACFSVPPVFDDVCLPVIERLDVWNIEAMWGNVPASVSSTETKWAVWRPRAGCPSRKLDGRMGTNDEALALIGQAFSNDADLNAWAKSFPVRDNTLAEEAFLQTQMAALAAKLNIPWPEVDTPPTPPPLTGPAYKVAKNGTVLTRPVYQRVSDTVRGTTEIGRVAVGDPCDQTVKSGTGGFYGVAGRPNLSKPGTVFAAGAVSGCSLASAP